MSRDAGYIIFACFCFLTLGGWVGWSSHVPAPPMKQYNIQIGDSKGSVKGDSIRQSGSCVILMRGTTVDTIYCPSSMDRFVITEANGE